MGEVIIRKSWTYERACMQHRRAASWRGVRPRASRRSATASFTVSCMPQYTLEHVLAVHHMYE